MTRAPVFRYLDLAGGWPGIERTGVVLDDDGVVRLAPLAGDPTLLVGEAAGAVAGAAGIGVARDGTIYVARPETNRIDVVRCDGSVERFACVDGPGTAVGQVRGPQAVLVGPREALYVADTDNGRIQVFDLATGQVTGVWTGLVEPVDLAADSSGWIYVADRGRPRLARYNADGREDAAFGDALAAGTAAPVKPRAVATLVRGDDERILLVDEPTGGTPKLLAFGLDGELDAELSQAFSNIVLADVASAQAAGDVLYVAGAGGVLAFGFDGSFLGRLPESHTSASGLALDCQGRLVVAGAGGVSRLEPTRRATRGHVLIGPLPLVGVIGRWDRVVAVLRRPLAPNAHVRISTQVTGGVAPPAPPPETAAVEEARARTAPGIWRSAPPDASDALVLHEEAPMLWIWIELEGDGRTTPEISAVRVEWIGLGLLGALPALYADADEDETAWRLFALLSSSLGEVQEAIDDLPLLFDATGVSDRADAPWLDALAAWLAMPLEREWDEQLRRRLVAEAFVEHGRRGTRSALEEMLGRAAGATVTVTEPAEAASIWELGEVRAVLGSTTMLTPAEADGAILGTTADVDRSYLTSEEDFGWPLFADVAHRFCVHVQAVAVDDVRLGALHAAIEREKPAHTLGHLCVLQPRTTVGFQSRVEIDMFVGPPPPTLSLGDELDLRHALRDADHTTVGGRVGETTRVGRRPAAAVVGGH
jgi:phage tail-like protein